MSARMSATTGGRCWWPTAGATALVVLALTPATGRAQTVDLEANLAAPAAEQVMTPGGDIPRRRTATSRTFIGPEGSLKTRIYADRVNYRDDNGRWQLIDNELWSDGAVLRNRANDYDLALPKDLASGAVRVANDGAWISFSPRGASGRARAFDDEARYRGAWPGVELRYEATGDAVKESLIVRDAAAIRNFAFDVRLRLGLTPIVRADGSIAIRDDASGAVPLTVRPSNMIDAAGAETLVRARLRPALGSWVLELVPDRRWLADPARRWPVTIDPQVSTGGVEACTITEFQSYCYEAGPLSVGDQGIKTRTLLRFDVASALPPGAYVEYADLFVTRHDGGTATFDTMEAHALTAPWVSPDWWSNGYDGWTNAGGDFVATPLDSPSSGESGVRSWELAELARAWADGDPNYGVILMSAPGAPIEPVADIKGLDDDAAPTLEIQYTVGDDPDGAIHELLVQSYVDDLGISEAEADERLEIQTRVSALSDALEDAIGEAAYGGMWYDDTDGGRAKIAVEANTPTPPPALTEDAEELLENHDLTDEVGFVSVESSRADLVAAQEDLFTEYDDIVDDGDVRLSIDPEASEVVVEVANDLTAGEQATVADGIANAPVDASQVPTGEPDLSMSSAAYECGNNVTGFGAGPTLSCNRPWRAGGTITSTTGQANTIYLCTGAFHARGKDPDGDSRYILTAGHCLQQDYAWVYGYNVHGTQRPIGRQQPPDSGPYDLGKVRIARDEYWFYPSSDALTRGYVFVGANPDPGAGTARSEAYPVEHVKASAKDQRICATGATKSTGGHYTICGKVQKLDIGGTDKETGKKLEHLGAFESCDRMQDGGSGGPVYVSHNAHGILTHRFKDKPCWHAYQGAIDAQKRLGVNITLSP